MKILKFVKSVLIFRLREGHACPLLIYCARVIRVLSESNITFIFFKNKVRKYAIIRLHHMKLYTVIAHIESLQI
jgi:hypothetical protein